MKKIIVLLSLGLCLLGCKKAISKDPGRVKITLEGNPTTGYGWSYELSVADIIELVSEDYVSDATDDDEIVGIGGNYYFVFVAKKAGDVQIVFSYKRPWEQEEPLESLVVNIKVKKDLSIEIDNKTNKNVEILP